MRGRYTQELDFREMWDDVPCESPISGQNVRTVSRQGGTWWADVPCKSPISGQNARTLHTQELARQGVTTFRARFQRQNVVTGTRFQGMRELVNEDVPQRNVGRRSIQELDFRAKTRPAKSCQSVCFSGFPRPHRRLLHNCCCSRMPRVPKLRAPPQFPTQVFRCSAPHSAQDPIPSVPEPSPLSIPAVLNSRWGECAHPSLPCNSQRKEGRR